MAITEIGSCSHVFEIVHKITAPTVLFRGQDLKAPLDPKFARIAREMKLERQNDYEHEILEQFKRQATPYVDLKHDSPQFRWLYLARHYGLPTRLLDWTTNPFVALWFAVEKRNPGDKQDSFLHVFEVDDYDLEYHPDSTSTYDIDGRGSVKAFRPFHIDRRISAQAGWFTVHPYQRASNSYLSAHKTTIRGELNDYWINNHSIEDIRNELLKMGISRANLFPDLGGISEAIEMDLRLGRIPIAAVYDASGEKKK